MRTIAKTRVKGFTLVELIITIIVIGILSATAIISIGTKAQASAATQADEFRRALSHLQLLAISQGFRLKLTVATSSYSVCDAATYPTTACDATNAMTDPATGVKFHIALTDGAQFTAGPGDYYFDSLGRPVVAATGVTLVIDPAALVFRLNNVGRDQDVTVTVLPITGFAQTAYNLPI